MFEPGIQADDSLILNGDFSESLTHWKKGPTNDRWVAVVGELYGDVLIRMLSVGHLSSAYQEVTVPVTPDARARYVLSFLYETRHTEAGRMLITDERGTTLREILLPPGSPRNLEEDQARIALGLPLEFRPIQYNAPFDLPLQRLDRLRVTVVAPRNDPDDMYSVVLVTRIDLALHLEPVALQTLKLDDEQLPANVPLYLCLGADGGFQHRLECVPEPDSPWLYTKAALISDDNPQGAVTSMPDWGVDHPLDSPWILQCPLIGDQAPYLFTLNLVNQYTAAPYPLRISLGHHRLVFREVQEAAYYPVLALAQSVRLGVRVASWYTGQFLAGRAVTWTIDGQRVLGAASTDSEGWAYLDYLPTAAGDISIVASVASPYYASGVVTTPLAVRVLATDPWKDVLAVVEGNALPWAQKTGYPNRGSTYQLSVRLPDVLRGTELALRWEGDSAAQLGVQVRPELDESVPVVAADLSWDLICRDDLDGRFQLQLSCSKLLLTSDRKPMSLARNLVRIGDVQEANKFPVVDEHESVLLRVQVVHMITSGEGDPVNNALVDWETPEGTISTRSGLGGWASVLYQPTRAGELVVSARVRAHDEAVAMERPFAVRALQSSPWKGKIKILFDGNLVDLTELGLLCWRGEPHTLRIEITPGSSLSGEMVTLRWRGEPPGIGLTVSDIDKPLRLGPLGLEWHFSSQVASSTSSLFSLALSTPGLVSPRELFGRLISTQLTDELTLMLDQVTATAAGQTLFPCIGARHNLRYLPKALSPLAGLQATLVWQGTPADDLEASIEPPLDQAQIISDGGVGWRLDFTSSKVFGAFSVGLLLSALDRSMSTHPMQLAHNKLRIEDWRESAVDAVVGKDKAWNWVRVVSAFTGQAVAQAAVQWKSAIGADIVTSDDLGWSGFGLMPGTAGKQEVVANVHSLFDGYEEQRTLSFTALARDPWEEVRVRFDGHDEHPWGRHTYFPRRNGSHAIEVLLPDGSPLLDQELTLGLTGTGPAELGLSFEPALGASRRPSAIGLRYSLNCADLKDGGFALRLGAERLANLSPANAMSLGEGAQVWKLRTTSSVQQVVEWEQELVEQVTVVASTTGKGIAGVVVTWRNEDLGTVTSVTDFYGVATVRFKPQTPGAAVLTATVGDGVYSESISISYSLSVPREIVDVVVVPAQGYPTEEVEAMATVISALTGLPLAGVEVMWDLPGATIASAQSDAQGRARTTFKLPLRSGVLEAMVRGGLGGWDSAQSWVEVTEDEPVLVELHADALSVYQGEILPVWALVEGRHSGGPFEQASVSWSLGSQIIAPSVTQVDGKAYLMAEPMVIGDITLTASILAEVESSRSLNIKVLDPASHPGHATIRDLRELKSPINTGSVAEFIGTVVSSVSGQPLPRRECYTSMNGEAFKLSYTGANGEINAGYWAHEPGVVSFKVEVRNPVGQPEKASASVLVIRQP
ncbi:hypothetical protein ACIOUG_14435 [Pseudomonas sp. NPDC087803]|uniref:hypothetical protein n=1 Tax=Pseudomonas sp. NPDC087803 TaxID=3364448 RepID=UPI0037F9B703